MYFGSMEEAYEAMSQREFGKVYHVDGTNGSDSNDGLSWDKAFVSIQAAVDATTDLAGDVIRIAPGQYSENVLIKDKNRVSLIGVPIANKETRIRASGATTKRPFTPVGQSAVLGCCIVVLSTCVQIANLTLDASGNYVGIYVGDGTRINAGYNEDTNGSWIHDNFFKYGTWGIALDGCSEDHKIENNILYRCSSGGMHIAPGSNRTVQRVYVLNNTFAADETGYGVYMYNSASVRTCHFRGNAFLDGVKSDGTSCAFTKPLLTQGAGIHTIVGNYFACTQEGTQVATDFSCGNYFGGTGATTIKAVDET